MPITLGTNIASLQAQRQLSQTESSLGTVFERLSSGQRINRASDDAAGLAIASDLQVDQRVYTQGIRNIGDGISVLNIADSALNELTTITVRLQELAQQAANGTLNNQQRETLDQEAQALREEYFRISRSTEFNGLNLFDGSLDLFRVQAGYGVDGGIASELGGAVGTGEFGSDLFGTGLNGQTISIDINSDGHDDLIRFAAGDISIYHGDGEGGLNLSRTLSPGATYDSFAIGDVNNDGFYDLVASGDAGDIAYLANGDGSFQGLTSQAAAANFDIRKNELRDVNGDGVLDLIRAGQETSGSPRDGTVRVRLGNGDGSFGDEVESTLISVGTQNIVSDIEFADLNGDGILDAVAGGYQNTSNQAALSIAFGNGDGTFAVQSSFVSTSTIGSNFEEIELGDFNNDGTLDIVAFKSGSANAEVITYLGQGSGQFSQSSSFSLGGASQARSLATIDANGDGILDIVYGATNASYLQLGSGDGSFDTAQTLFTTASTSISVGDFNNDGVPDLHLTGVGGVLAETASGIQPLAEFSLQNMADARSAFAEFQKALERLSVHRGEIGAFQSRLESAVNTLRSTTENYATAESRIRDAEIANETSQLVRLSILRQASSAVLAQSNQQPALALRLLT